MRLVCLWILGLVVSAGSARALVVPHSGMLLGADDGAVTGDRSLRFDLYDVGSGGTALWSSGAAGCVVPVRGGRYATVLGASCGPPISDNVWSAGDRRWIEVAVDGITLTPRLELGAVPLAQRALDADKLAGLTLTQLDSRYLASSGGSSSGPLQAPAFVGGGSGLTNVDAVSVGGQTLSQLDGRYLPTTGGDGSNLAHLDASQLDRGMVPDARLPSTLVRLDGTGKVPLGLLPTQIPDPARLTVAGLQTFAGPLAASAFQGSGAGLTGLNASQLTTGTVPDTALPADLVRRPAIGATVLGSAAQQGAEYELVLNGSSCSNAVWYAELESSQGDQYIEVRASFSHCGGGCHFTYRRWHGFFNAYRAMFPTEDILNDGNGAGTWTISRPTTSTSVHGEHSNRVRVEKSVGTVPYCGPVNVRIVSNAPLTLLSKTN